jgi:uncharacterized membrane protein YeaQ/YmgE (transglycosylase-associated protein family)
MASIMVGIMAGTIVEKRKTHRQQQGVLST